MSVIRACFNDADLARPTVEHEVARQSLVTEHPRDRMSAAMAMK
jgi:hypothetical protein